MPRRILLMQPPVIVNMDGDKEKYLVGWPGYRNAYGRSGLGYVETQAEWAHMRGRLFRMMVTGKVITRNPIFLFGMFIVGLIYSLPVILAFPEMLNGGEMGTYVFFMMSPSWLFGLLILRNVFIALTTSEEEGDANENTLDGGNPNAYNPTHQEE